MIKSKKKARKLNEFELAIVNKMQSLELSIVEIGKALNNLNLQIDLVGLAVDKLGARDGIEWADSKKWVLLPRAPKRPNGKGYAKANRKTR